ncbi:MULTISPECIES: hypothetical protein [unclassified Streptomyces]|uniref:hypothetical protein n=1 Tax=unclassified Streptomyces TaxID=2593676 RepID=UPI002877A2FC|nr:hypothetical protein [Streptomyces sp. BB1-1-1]WND32985.1 hypothetical protein RI578_01205 [Streptomyces sp. BB1-1-1]
MPHAELRPAYCTENAPLSYDLIDRTPHHALRLSDIAQIRARIETAGIGDTETSS